MSAKRKRATIVSSQIPLVISTARLTRRRYYSDIMCSDLIKKYQRVLEVSTVLFVTNVPLLYVHQSGKKYLIMTLENVVRIISKFDVNG